MCIITALESFSVPDCVAELDAWDSFGTVFIGKEAYKLTGQILSDILLIDWITLVLLLFCHACVAAEVNVAFSKLFK